MLRRMQGCTAAKAEQLYSQAKKRHVFIDIDKARILKCINEK